METKKLSFGEVIKNMEAGKFYLCKDYPTLIYTIKHDELIYYKTEDKSWNDSVNQFRDLINCTWQETTDPEAKPEPKTAWKKFPQEKPKVYTIEVLVRNRHGNTNKAYYNIGEMFSIGGFDVTADVTEWAEIPK